MQVVQLQNLFSFNSIVGDVTKGTSDVNKVVQAVGGKKAKRDSAIANAGVGAAGGLAKSLESAFQQQQLQELFSFNSIVGDVTKGTSDVNKVVQAVGGKKAKKDSAIANAGVGAAGGLAKSIDSMFLLQNLSTSADIKKACAVIVAAANAGSKIDSAVTHNKTANKVGAITDAGAMAACELTKALASAFQQQQLQELFSFNSIVGDVTKGTSDVNKVVQAVGGKKAKKDSAIANAGVGAAGGLAKSIDSMFLLQNLSTSADIKKACAVIVAAANAGSKIDSAVTHNKTANKVGAITDAGAMAACELTKALASAFQQQQLQELFSFNSIVGDVTKGTSDVNKVVQAVGGKKAKRDSAIANAGVGAAGGLAKSLESAFQQQQIIILV